MQMIYNILLCYLGKKKICVQYRRNFKKTFSEYLIDSETTLWPLDILNILIFILVIDMKASSSVITGEVVENRAASTFVLVLTTS